jgi:hypothetical protein
MYCQKKDFKKTWNGSVIKRKNTRREICRILRDIKEKKGIEKWWKYDMVEGDKIKIE